MEIKIVKIGNSRGIRIPKSFIEQSGLQNKAELEIVNDKIVIKPILRNRDKWKVGFKKMANNKDDILLDSNLLLDQSKWDKEEWEW